MIKNNNKSISSVYDGATVIGKIYKGIVRLYESWRKLITSGIPPLSIYSKGEELIDYKIEGNRVQDGTPTPDTPVEIESVGDKTDNLFDNDINGAFVKKDGNDLVLNNYSCSTGMKPSEFLAMTGLKVGDKFTIKRSFTIEKGTGNNVTGAMRFLKSSSGNWQLISGSQSINTVTIPADFNDENYTYLYVYGAITKDENGELLTRFKKVQIAKGSYTNSTMPKYEPYGYRIPVKVSGIDVEPFSTNIYLKEPLRKIDEYFDYIDFEKGKVYRKIYNEFFEKVTSTSSEVTTYKKFITNISKKPLLKSTNPNSSNAGDMMGYAISNKFMQSKVNYNNLGKYPNLIQSYITTSGGNRVACTFDDSSIITVAQANEKLGDGFDVCYVLEKEITETVELPNISTHKGTTVIEVDTSITPSNMEVTYYGKGV